MTVYVNWKILFGCNFKFYLEIWPLHYMYFRIWPFWSNWFLRFLLLLACCESTPSNTHTTTTATTHKHNNNKHTYIHAHLNTQSRCGPCLPSSSHWCCCRCCCCCWRRKIYFMKILLANDLKGHFSRLTRFEEDEEHSIE